MQPVAVLVMVVEAVVVAVASIAAVVAVVAVAVVAAAVVVLVAVVVVTMWIFSCHTIGLPVCGNTETSNDYSDRNPTFKKIWCPGN